MFGNNPLRPPIRSDGLKLDVQNIFPTFQGEGPFVGQPAIFIRLGGCNLACSFCDTEFEDFQSIPTNEVLDKVNTLSGLKNNNHTYKLAVITGGEPLRQNIKLLCDNLIKDGYKVQIETNGTLYQDLNDDVKIICSPKNSGYGYKSIREDLLPKITALKFIISASQKNYEDIAEVGQKKYNIPIYVQPMDEYESKKNQQNTSHTVALALKYGYFFCLQTHKIVGVE